MRCSPHALGNSSRLAGERLRRLHSPGTRMLRPIHFHAGDSRGARAMADANLNRLRTRSLRRHPGKSWWMRGDVEGYGLHWHDRFAAASGQIWRRRSRTFTNFLRTPSASSASEELPRRPSITTLAIWPTPRASRPAPRRMLAKIPGLELRDLPETGIVAARRDVQLERAGDVRSLGAAEDGQTFSARARRSS